MAERPNTSSHPSRRRAIGMALGTGAALAGAGVLAPPAAAAAPSGTWRNVPVPDGTAPQMWAVSAPTRRTAFAIGQHSWSQLDVTSVLHWNGRAWRPEPVPPMKWNWYMDLAAASPRAAWIVGLGLNDQAPASLYWNGVRWRVAPLPVDDFGPLFPSVTAEPGGTAWTIVNGARGVSGSTALLRFERGAWVRKSAPLADGDFLHAVAARSRRDVWLAVVAANSQTFTLNWNGVKWRRHDLDGMYNPDRVSLLPVSRTSVWAYLEEQLWHWDGAAWSKVTNVPRHGWLVMPYSGSLVSDGHGGLWLGHLAEATSGYAGYLHWDGSTWTTFLGPAREYNGRSEWAQVTDIAPIPGTRSMWAVGYVGTGLSPFIERFG
ncbi:hypothetical protein GCM10010191_55260 [Actinomadura vinacea]|uniref:Tat pathway signal sequence domain protein n=1 Tax=Actinomadura vinacea TaxID=115336 RepID=A0ABN3JNV3_9ACTN